MRIIRFDSIGGASGDMILGALLDLGADREALLARLQTLDIGPFTLAAEPASERGLHGTRVTVHTPESHHPVHRHLGDVRRLIAAGDIPPRVRGAAIAAFERLAAAEAAVHRTTPEHVHFHEVGAVDAIVDIVGGCLALDLLGADAVEAGPLPAGHGTVTCAHGVFPVPAPATVELLRGWPIVTVDEAAELVTPTGAALLTAWAAGWGEGGRPGGALTLGRSGLGFGHRRLAGRANVLRALVLETAPAPAEADECLVLECNLDDTVPELIGAASARLLDAGALDVFAAPVFMKKQRPGTLLTVLCRPDDRERMLALLFAETTTFGVREHAVRRAVLARRHVEVATPYGPIRIKVGARGGRDVTAAPEFEDCARQAAEHGVAVRAVYAAAQRAAGAPAESAPGS